jgi:hypothetical protein
VASYETYPEIRADVLSRAEEELRLNASEFYQINEIYKPGVGADTPIAPYVDRALDRAYEDLLNRRPWLFARAPLPYILRFNRPFDVTIQHWEVDTLTCTLSAVLPIASPLVLGRKLKPSGSVIAYRIVRVENDDFTLELEAPLTPTPQQTIGPALLNHPAMIFQDEYVLPTTIRQIVGIWLMDSTFQIDGPWSDERLREHYPNPIIGTWPPTAFARPAQFLLRFAQYPTQNGLGEVPITDNVPAISTTETSDEIIVPKQWRWVLSDGGLAHLLDIKHDNREPKWRAFFEAGIERMIGEDDRNKMGIEGTRVRQRKEPAWR